MVWVRGGSIQIERDRAVPLVTYRQPCIYHQLAETALKAVGLHWENVFTGPSLASLAGAVASGLGVMALIRRVAGDLGMIIWEDAPLPKLPDLYCGIYVREGGPGAVFEQMADDIGTALQAISVSPPKLIALRDKPRKANPAA